MALIKIQAGSGPDSVPDHNERIAREITGYLQLGQSSSLDIFKRPNHRPLFILSRGWDNHKTRGKQLSSLQQSCQKRTQSSAPLVLTTAWPLALICAGCDPLHWWPGHCEPAIGEIEWSAQSEEYTGWTPGQGNVNIQFVPLVSSPAPVTGDWSCSVCVKIPHFTAVNPICLVIPPSQTPAYCQARSELNI